MFMDTERRNFAGWCERLVGITDPTAVGSALTAEDSPSSFDQQVACAKAVYRHINEVAVSILFAIDGTAGDKRVLQGLITRDERPLQTLVDYVQALSPDWPGTADITTLFAHACADILPGERSALQTEIIDQVLALQNRFLTEDGPLHTTQDFAAVWRLSQLHRRGQILAETVRCAHNLSDRVRSFIDAILPLKEPCDSEE